MSLVVTIAVTWPASGESLGWIGVSLHPYHLATADGEDIGDRHVVRAAINQAPEEVMHDDDVAAAAVGSSL
jgi:hypothetical protein